MVVLYLRMLGKLYNYKLPSVSFLFVVKKVSEKLVNNKLVDHLEKCDLFYDL